MPMRTLYFTAFVICGIAFCVWLETWAQANRQAYERLLEELADTELCTQQGYCGPCEAFHPFPVGTSWPNSITISNHNGSSITHTTT